MFLTESEIKKIEALSQELLELEQKIAQITDYSQGSIFQSYNQIKHILEIYEQYQNLEQQYQETQIWLNEEKDDETIQLIKLELSELEAEIKKRYENINDYLNPADPLQDRDTIIEIRAGTGGEEANLFVGDLFRMYTKFAQQQGWYVLVEETQEGERKDSFKEVIFTVSGDKCYKILKYEAGVHRVQRVPATETKGRVHTSAASVAVIPKTEEDETDIVLNESVDLDIKAYCASSGPGGQGVNTAYSAVMVTHKESGLTIRCKESRSYLQNKDRAIEILKAKLWQQQREEKMAQESELRMGMIGSGDRSDKIRTYNFPQGRVTDHRVKLTSHNLDKIMTGDLNDFLTDLQDKISLSLVDNK